MQRSFAPSRINDQDLRGERAGTRVRAALSAALAREIEGEVRFDGGSRALYATDASNYRQVPIGVVLPRSIHDVIATVRPCREHGAPVLPRDGGTSLCGQCCNVAVVIDFSKYLNRIVEIDRARKIARVQPGVVLDDLRHAANREGLTFGPDPATHNHNTLGGMIGNNSCGPHYRSVLGTDAGREVPARLGLDFEVLDSGCCVMAGCSASRSTSITGLAPAHLRSAHRIE